ncbi:tetratricopeptide repeat protein [Bernardetia sp. OM2101]|uniref:tetratricopeptide repeat protein n=1 Tax=Bernardetia sp. OM2101 TaxID=3344876 RepID=UPI0035D12385
MRNLFVLLLVFSFQNCFAQIKSSEQAREIQKQVDSLVKIKEYDKIITLYESLLTKVDIIDTGIYYEIAFIYYTKNDFEKTLINLDKSLSLSKKTIRKKLLSDIHFLYSRTYSKQGNHKKAIKELKKSLKYNDKLLEAQATLTYEYLRVKKYKKAIKEAEKTIKLDTKEPYAYNNAGLALIKLKKYEEGRKMIMTSLELDPTNPYAYKHLAYYYIAIKDLDKACKALNKADELGYKDFGNEADQNEVEELIKKHCK